jgi:hypothetical protein
MSTNSPEEAHEETETPSPAQMKEPGTEKDPGEPRGDRRASGELNHSLPD